MLNYFDIPEKVVVEIKEKIGKSKFKVFNVSRLSLKEEFMDTYMFIMHNSDATCCNKAYMVLVYDGVRGSFNWIINNCDFKTACSVYAENIVE